MKAGKLPQAVLERSVLRYVKKENKNAQPPAVGFDAGVFLVKEVRMAAMTQTVSGEGVRTGASHMCCYTSCVYGRIRTKKTDGTGAKTV